MHPTLHPTRAAPSDGEFEQWWSMYPHKVGKAGARKAYDRARQKAYQQTLLDGVQRYVATKPDDRPWCHPKTWLNQERWTDEPAAYG